MRRLAFIRLLHQQGTQQSRLPDPLAAACVLTYHDAVELFLILASEHLKITIPDHGPFIKRFWDGLHPDKAGPNGVDLAGKVGMKRLTTQRNSFKHDAAHPAGTVIEQARVDATQFFEDNTPKVFGVPFDGIDMADLVPQAGTRDKIKKASEVEAAGDRTQALGWLVEAFDELFKIASPTSSWSPSPYSFGMNINHPMSESDIAQILRQPDEHSRRKPTRGASRLAEELFIVRESVRSLQKGMRVMTLGIDYHEYQRFEVLSPMVWRAHEDHLELHTPDGYAPTAEHWAFCQQFVITAALRIADAMAHRQRPPWAQN